MCKVVYKLIKTGSFFLNSALSPGFSGNNQIQSPSLTDQSWPWLVLTPFIVSIRSFEKSYFDVKSMRIFAFITMDISPMKRTKIVGLIKHTSMTTWNIAATFRVAKWSVSKKVNNQKSFEPVFSKQNCGRKCKTHLVQTNFFYPKVKYIFASQIQYGLLFWFVIFMTIWKLNILNKLIQFHIE